MKVLVSISHPEDYYFFERMNSYFEREKVNIEYIANNLLIYLFLKIKTKSVFIVKNSAKSGSWNKNFSVLTGRVTEDEAKTIYGSINNEINKRHTQSPWDIFLIPSGRLINHVALTDYAKKNQIKTLYIGYGNIPNRTFVDSEGTDKESLLYKDINILENYKADKNKYENWRNVYIKEKLKRHSIGQARSYNLSFQLKKILQVLFCYLERLFSLSVENSYHWNDLHIFSKKKQPVIFDKDLPDEFIFFPMQVSTDAQIILNYSKMDVLEGLKDAYTIAKNKGISLVVNLHPAEINQTILERLEDLKEQLGFYISEKNTFHLIRDASEVIVINSTVGLESIIFEKKVTFLGDSIYKKMTNELAKNYIMEYLLHIDYFNKHPMDFERVEEFLSRAK